MIVAGSSRRRRSKSRFWRSRRKRSSFRRTSPAFQELVSCDSVCGRFQESPRSPKAHCWGCGLLDKVMDPGLHAAYGDCFSFLVSEVSVVPAAALDSRRQKGLRSDLSSLHGSGPEFLEVGGLQEAHNLEVMHVNGSFQKSRALIQTPSGKVLIARTLAKRTSNLLKQPDHDFLIKLMRLLETTRSS